ncbi:DNA-(apurinic or apyrimidinic site) lyase [Magnetococcus marinus MC-1]|uniref:Endonuclease III n=1 Tax=Magnetococcus marinus (strain ATCC BAA-1437 / JCM 17883 / MC-1) TaxID=156889 RepID=A0L845_MAGMM|nr:endonuclease III [Magnetococcus marinus]ABK44138.1 DNA-(apurinic or apyrimidinic site) lyase [Magnetococcus marinus MC-1]
MARKSKHEIESIFSTLKAANPEPKSELDYRNPFELLVAVVLSAQSTDAGVNKATPGLFAAAPTPQAMADLGEEGIKPYIRTIGLFNSKAKNLGLLAKKLVAEHDSQVPQSREALQALPGVGRKTANVVLNVAFGQPTMAVDTHVFRVSNRLGLVSSKTPESTEAPLIKVIPPHFMDHAHHWLILLGRYTCKARKPLCESCSVAQWCSTDQRQQRVDRQK